MRQAARVTPHFKTEETHRTISTASDEGEGVGGEDFYLLVPEHLVGTSRNCSMQSHCYIKCVIPVKGDEDKTDWLRHKQSS